MLRVARGTTMLLCGASCGWCRWLMPWLDHGWHRNCEGGFSLNHFCIISKPLMCATIWIKHLGIAIVTSSRMKHVGIKRNQQ